MDRPRNIVELTKMTECAESRIDYLESALADERARADAACKVILAQGKIADELRARADAAEAKVAELERQRAAMAEAIRRVLDDEATGEGRGPDVTMVGVLRDAFAASGLECVPGWAPPDTEPGRSFIVRPEPVTKEWRPCTVVIEKEADNG